MKVLTLLVLCLSLSKGFGQNLLTSPKQYDFTTNIIEPISTSQSFNQYGFTPQLSNLPYPLSTAQTLQPSNKQNANTQRPTSKSFPIVTSTNIPVQASYQVADYVLVPSGAHAYPVQHSVEINHSDYDPFANIFVQQHTEQLPRQRNQNVPPITRPLHPQFVAPIRPQQPLKPYNGQIGFKPYVANSQNVRGPQIFKAPIQNPNGILPGQKLYQQPTSPNLPYNFKTIPTAPKPNHQQQQNNLVPLNKPSGFIPKPLPSPLKTLPTTPVPVAGKGNSREDGESRERAESKPVKEEEEEDESEEDEESGESDDEEEEEEGGEEKDYRPRYSYNRPVNTEFDKRNYRPTFDAAKYIFNEDNSDEDESDESEEENGSRERPPPPKKEEPRNSYYEQPKQRQDSYRVQAIDAGPKRAEKNIRIPQPRRATSEESREQVGKGSRFVAIQENPYKKRYRGYYDE